MRQLGRTSPSRAYKAARGTFGRAFASSGGRRLGTCASPGGLGLRCAGMDGSKRSARPFGRPRCGRARCAARGSRACRRADARDPVRRGRRGQSADHAEWLRPERAGEADRCRVFSPYGNDSQTASVGDDMNFLLVQIRGTGDSDGSLRRPRPAYPGGCAGSAALGLRSALERRPPRAQRLLGERDHGLQLAAPEAAVRESGRRCVRAPSSSTGTCSTRVGSAT